MCNTVIHEERKIVAQKVLFVSDITGEEIKDGEYAKVSITHGDSMYVLDARYDEVQHFISLARKMGKRGRRRDSARV